MCDSSISCHTHIEPKDRVKYLGAILDQTLAGESMVNSILQRATLPPTYLSLSNSR